MSSDFVFCLNVLEASCTSSVDPDQTAQEQSNLGPHCLSLYLNWSIILVNICSRRLQQTLFFRFYFFVGALRVKINGCGDPFYDDRNFKIYYDGQIGLKPFFRCQNVLLR